MLKILYYFPVVSSLLSGTALFFPSILLNGQHAAGVLSFWNFSFVYPVGFAVPLLYVCSAVAYLLAKKHQKLLYGILHFIAFFLFCLIVFSFSDINADIPTKYISVMVGEFFLPLFTVGYYIFNPKLSTGHLAKLGLPQPEFDRKYSPIVIANGLAEMLRAHNQYPLTEENLCFQTDALARLDSEDEEEWGPFASFNYDRLPNDSAFSFTLEMSRHGFDIQIADMVIFQYPYTVFDSDKHAAEQLFQALTVLSNGQLEVLLSVGSKGVYAMEVLLYKQDRLSAVVIDTNVTFPLFGINNATTERLRNTVSTEFTVIPDDFFMHRLQPDGYFPPTGRVLAGVEVRGLTRKEYRQITYELVWAGTGKVVNENYWWYVYRHWEFWALVSVSYGGIGVLFVLHVIQSAIILQHPIILVVPVTIITTAIMPLFLRKRQQRVAASTIDNG